MSKQHNRSVQTDDHTKNARLICRTCKQFFLTAHGEGSRTQVRRSQVCQQCHCPLRTRSLWKLSTHLMNHQPSRFFWMTSTVTPLSKLTSSFPWLVYDWMVIYFSSEKKRVKDRRLGQGDFKWCWLHKGVQPTDSVYIVLESLRW